MTRRSHALREFVAAIGLTLLVVSPPAIALLAQAPGGQGRQGLPDLVQGLKSTPGCLGVELGQTASGKQVIFAWFENRQALLKWYYSPTHQTLMRMLTPDAKSGRAPLAGITDDSGPIMAIASLTYADTAKVSGVQMPISQIAIELYAPLPGGLAMGGRFGPSSVKVPQLLEAPETK